MNDSYIKKSIEYLAEKQSVDKLLEQTDKVKSIIMGSNYWKDRKKIIEQVLRCDVRINTKDIVGKIEVGAVNFRRLEDRTVAYEYSIQGGSVIADLCNAFKVDIPQDLTTKFGQKLDSESKEGSNSADDYNEILSNLQQTLKKTISKTLNIGVNTELSDDQIYQIVSRLPDYEEESKKLLLKSLRKTNGVENPDAELGQFTPDLFKLLEDKNLKKYIDDYKSKPLSERKKDPLRQVFRWNENTQNYNLNNITKDKTIKQWFEWFMNEALAKKDRGDIYFVLLELFGKDFEFGGGYDGEIPKAKLWNKVDQKAVKAWYKKKKIQTDLFDDLQIEKEKKIVIIEEHNDNNMDVSKKNKKKNGTEEKQTETSKTGYKIGLGLDILVTILSGLLRHIKSVIFSRVDYYCSDWNILRNKIIWVLFEF